MFIFVLLLVEISGGVFRGFVVRSWVNTKIFDTDTGFQGGFENIDNNQCWQLISCAEVYYSLLFISYFITLNNAKGLIC